VRDPDGSAAGRDEARADADVRLGGLRRPAGIDAHKPAGVLGDHPHGAQTDGDTFSALSDRDPSGFGTGGRRDPHQLAAAERRRPHRAVGRGDPKGYVDAAHLEVDPAVADPRDAGRAGLGHPDRSVGVRRQPDGALAHGHDG